MTQRALPTSAWALALLLTFLLAVPGVAVADETLSKDPAASSATQTQADNKESTMAGVEPASTAWDFEQVLRYEPQVSEQLDTAALLDEILKQPEYLENAGASPKESWLEQLLNRLQAWLDQLGMPNSGPWGALLAVLLAFLLAAILVRVLWGIWTRRAGRPEKQHQSTAVATDETELLAQSRRAAAQGMYRDAVRLRYMALLYKLGIPTSSLLTNWQLLRKISQTWPQARDEFAALVRCYEDAWYGAQPCFVAEYETTDRLAASVQVLIKVNEAER